MDKKRERNYLIWLCIIVFFLFGILYIASTSKLGRSVSGYFEGVTIPLQKIVYNLPGVFQLDNQKATQALKKENRELIDKLVDYEKLKRENVAFRSQFQTSGLSSQSLLPANIVGINSFVPGVSIPDSFTIDKGAADKVEAGNVVVLENVVVGRVVKTSGSLSRVHLITNKEESITATAVKTKALGIIKGRGERDMIFDNVLLSEKLEVSDTVISKGDIGIDGKGIPPNLIIGKITGVERKTSELFQTAKVASPIDLTKLSVVFIIR